MGDIHQITPQPALEEKSRVRRLRNRGLDVLMRLLDRLPLAGTLKSTEFTDHLTGQHVRISVGTHETCISVDGRDWFFFRWSGKQSGSGSSMGGEEL